MIYHPDSIVNVHMGLFRYFPHQYPQKRREKKPEQIDRGYKRIVMPRLYPIVIQCLLCQVYPLMYFYCDTVYYTLYHNLIHCKDS